MQALYQALPLVHIFRIVAAQGSFQAAANTLKLPRSSVSKKIQQLEAIVEEPVFTRSTRKLTLTHFGQSLLEQSSKLEGLLQNLDKLVESHHEAPSGKVSLSCSVLLGQSYLIPLLKALREHYPHIVLDISFVDETVDFYEAGIDIALRVGELPDSSLVAKKVGEKTRALFAAPAYLEAHGEPQSPQALSGHSYLACQNKHRSQNYLLLKNKQGMSHNLAVYPSIFSDNSRAIVDMAVAGLGIVMLDPLGIRQEIQHKKLRPILTDWHYPETSPIHLISLGKPQRSRAADCIWRYLCDNLSIA